MIAEGTPDKVRSNTLVREVYLGGGAMFDDASDVRPWLT